MYHGTLALLVRALRVDSRSARIFFGYAALMVGAMLSLGQAQAWGILFGAPGQRMFASMIWMDGFAVVLISCTYFAAAISEEKDEMTLGLLKMAGISPVALILGKGLPRLMHILILVVLQIPFVLMAITLGGVTAQQIYAAYVTLLAMAVLGFGIAMFASVYARTARGATALCAVLLMSVVCASIWFMLLSTWFFYFTGMKPGPAHAAISGFLSKISLFGRYDAITSSAFRSGVFHQHQLVHCCVGLVGLVAAWLVFEPRTRNLVKEAPIRRTVSRQRRTIFRPSRPWKWALAWKDFHFQRGGRIRLLVRILGIPILTGIFVGSIVIAGAPNFRDFSLWYLLVVSGAFFCLELVSIAGSFLKSEIKQETWSSLFLLPLTPGEIVRRKLAGCAVCLLPSAAWFCAGLLPQLDVRDVSEFFDFFLSDQPLIGMMVFLEVVLTVLLYLSLTTYLSLSIHFGAAVLAFFIMQFASMFVGIIGALIVGFLHLEAEVVVMMLVIVTFCAVIFFWVATRQKLLDLAQK